MTVLINRWPEVMAFTVDPEKYLIQVPLITRSGMPATQLIGISLAECPAPLADGFVGHHNPTRKEQCFDVTIAQAETEVEPDAMADDLRREAMIFVGIGWGWWIHMASMAYQVGTRQVAQQVDKPTVLTA
jgi:hypothetical protein